MITNTDKTYRASDVLQLLELDDAVPRWPWRLERGEWSEAQFLVKIDAASKRVVDIQPAEGK